MGESEKTAETVVTPKTESEHSSEILARVKTLPKALKIALSKQSLETLDGPQSGPSPRCRPVEELIGLGAGDSPPPDDEQVRVWIDEYRMEKYG